MGGVVIVAAIGGGGGRGDVCTGDSCDACGEVVGGARVDEGVESEAVGGAGAPATAEI